MMDLLGADLPVEGGAPGEFSWYHPSLPHPVHGCNPVTLLAQVDMLSRVTEHGSSALKSSKMFYHWSQDQQKLLLSRFVNVTACCMHKTFLATLAPDDQVSICKRLCARGVCGVMQFDKSSSGYCLAGVMDHC